jgi:hypothetical protein
MLTKSDTIDAITKLNPTANPGFLAGFSGDELVQYLGRLESVCRTDNRQDPAAPVTPSVAAMAETAVPGHAC